MHKILTVYRHPTPGDREILVAIDTPRKSNRIYLTEAEALAMAYELMRLAAGQGGDPVKLIAETFA